MTMNEKEMISITDANKNFSKVVKILEKENKVIILKNNKPVYVLTKLDSPELNENEKLELVALRILLEHQNAFKELAKWNHSMTIKFYCYNNLL